MGAQTNRTRSSLASVLVVLVPTALIGGMYLWPFLTGHSVLPFGFDTPKYMWRANLVADRGLHSLIGSAPIGFNVNADRPGYPVIAALVRSVLGVVPLQLAFVLSAVIGVSIGLAAGAFAVRSLREPLWAFPIYAVTVGASVNVARTAVGYTDNLIFDALAVAAALLVILVVQSEGGLVGGIALIACGALIHWDFALLFSSIVVALAALLLPASYKEWKAGKRALDTPSIRLGMLIGGSVAAGAGALALGPSMPVPVPSLPATTIDRKDAIFTRSYGLPILGPVAAAGVPALWWPRDQTRRRALLLAVLWAAVGAAPIVALHVFHLTVPAYRFLGFALGLPILGAAAVAGLGRLVSRWGVAGVVLAVVLSIAGVAAQSTFGYREWSGHDPFMSPEQLAQVTTAGRYMAAVGGPTPVIFVVDRPGVALEDHIIRSELPGDQITRSLIYLGTTENLLAGKQTLKRQDSRFDVSSQKAWPAVQAVLGQQPAIIFLSTFNTRAKVQPQGWDLAPGVRVVRGIRPPVPVVASAPIVGPSGPALVGIALAVLLFFAVVGLGWTASLVPTGWLERVSVAPAFGVAALAAFGVLADRLGFRLLGTTGVGIVVAAAVLGWVPFAVRRWRAGRAVETVL
jgi:hypothetical protein